MSRSNLEEKAFRHALSKFATGVTIVTTRDGQGNPIGITANSFNSVSLDPALVLWSVGEDALSSSVFETVDYFAVNVLSSTQLDMSNRFASRSEYKFMDIPVSDSPQGSPLFDGCLAQFECKTWNVYEGGDHKIIVGEVLDFRQNDALEPLIFFGGDYAKLK